MPPIVGPPRVDDVERFWDSPPPEPSKRLQFWMDRVADGWRGNKRIRVLDYYDSAEYFGVYIWEWINVLAPQLQARWAQDAQTGVRWRIISVLMAFIIGRAWIKRTASRVTARGTARETP